MQIYAALAKTSHFGENLPRRMAAICNLTIQKLYQKGISILENYPVEGCGLPVARHRDETAPTTSGLNPNLSPFIFSSLFFYLFLFCLLLFLLFKVRYFHLVLFGDFAC
jgi:hypothetical protein